MAFYTLGENDLKELRELSANSIGVLKKEGGFTATQTSRILVIGLGGMGLKTVQHLKAELRDRVGTINSSLLRILSLDTAKMDRETALSTGLLSPEEILCWTTAPLAAHWLRLRNFALSLLARSSPLVSPLH